MSKRAPQRTTPELPLLPEQLVAAPDELSTRTDWFGMAASSTMAVPDTVYDLEMIECVWQGVDAHGCTFAGLKCRDVVFDRCDFSAAVLESALLTRVHFRDCRLTGAVFSGAELNDVVIERGIADLTSFRGSVARFLWTMNTSLKSADFYDARLSRSALLDTDLTTASFDRASINGLSLHGSVVDSVRGAGALADADVGIEDEQVLPLGMALIADLAIRVTARPGRP